MSLVIDKKENSKEFVKSTLSEIWVTRCPVPTATGISLKRGTLIEKFEQHGIDVAVLQDARKGLSVHHFDHQLPALFREGGNVPALAARSEGAPSRLIGLTWIDEWQVIIVRPDSEISKPEHLKNVKVALPEYADKRAGSIFRAMSLQGIRGALQLANLTFRDVDFIEVPERAESNTQQRDASTYWSGLDALITGEVDAVYVKGASAVEAATKRGLKVGIDLAAIEAADALIVGTPVYRASFTGLFKHLFDFVEQTALVDVPVLLAASGGSDRHALVLEHQLRPLFSFFQAQTLPIGVYATDRDFTPEYTVKSEALNDRILLAVARALPILQWAPAKGLREQKVKAKSEKANQDLSINKQVEQDSILPSVEVPDLDVAEARLHHKKTIAV